ncbi:MAG: YfcE family phosphodiesterase [Flavobacteriales bacterium]|nr:MAG: YfcE family phosphodiesterase [Flavobacteriales bacterium]
MKKILLLSDTHGHIDEKIIKHVKWADEVWHAGDIGTLATADNLKSLKPLRAVYGNIDGHEIRQEFPLDNIFTVEKTKVFITHIGGYPGKYNPHVKEILLNNDLDIFICGHSHILKVMYDKKHKVLHLNPGAAGNHGFHSVRTMLRFTLNNGKIENLEIVELAKRG